MTGAFIQWLVREGRKHVNSDPKREAVVRDAENVVLIGGLAARADFLHRLAQKRHTREVDTLCAAWLREGRTDV